MTQFPVPRFYTRSAFTTIWIEVRSVFSYQLIKNLNGFLDRSDYNAIIKTVNSGLLLWKGI